MTRRLRGRTHTTQTNRQMGSRPSGRTRRERDASKIPESAGASPRPTSRLTMQPSDAPFEPIRNRTSSPNGAAAHPSGPRFHLDVAPTIPYRHVGQRSNCAGPRDLRQSGAWGVAGSQLHGRRLRQGTPGCMSRLDVHVPFVRSLPIRPPDPIPWVG